MDGRWRQFARYPLLLVWEGGGHFAFDEKSFLAIRIFSAALGGNDSSLENISRDEAMKHECFHE